MESGADLSFGELEAVECMGKRRRASLLPTALLAFASLASAFAASAPAFSPPSLLPVSRQSPLVLGRRAVESCRPVAVKTRGNNHKPLVKMVVLELYCKQAQLLESLVPNVIIPLHQRLSHHGPHGRLSRVLLTYKGAESAICNPIDAAALRRALPPDVAVSCVWSAKNADVGSGLHARGAHASKEDATFAQLVKYNAELSSAGCDSLLVVSGTGKKKALDTLATLSRVASLNK